MTKDMISIIIPVYKTEKYLKRCIESALSQTYQKLEIILVDDGSPDECPRICDEYAHKDNRIKVIHKENGGVSSARNIALDVAKGKYITFLDSDDFLEQEACEILYKTAIQHNADVVTCGMTMRYSSSSVDVYCDNKVYKNKACLNAYLADEIRPEACGKLIKRELINDVRFDENISYGEDLMFNFQIIKSAECMVNIEECLYNYNHHNATAATAPYITQARINSYLITKHILNECENLVDIKTIALWRHIRTLFAIMSRIITADDADIFNQYYDTITNEILLHKWKVIFNTKLSLKYKLGTLVLIINRKNYARFIKKIRLKK